MAREISAILQEYAKSKKKENPVTLSWYKFDYNVINKWNWTEKYELIYAPHLPQRAIAAFPDYDSFISIIFLHVLQFSRGNAIDSELYRSIHNMYDNIERHRLAIIYIFITQFPHYYNISINNQVLFPNWMILYRVLDKFNGCDRHR